MSRAGGAPVPGLARAVSGLVDEYVAGRARRARLLAERDRLLRRLAELGAELGDASGRKPAARSTGDADAIRTMRLGVAERGPRELAP